MQEWPTVMQVGMIQFAMLAVYVLGLPLVSLSLRYRRSRVLSDSASIPVSAFQPGGAGSLAWLGHPIFAVLLLFGLSIIVWRPTHDLVNPAILVFGCCIIISGFVINWREIRRPPIPASDLTLTPGAGYIDINWTPPDDPRCAACLLVRGSATSLPSHPSHGEVIYRGVLSAWRDNKVMPGVPYSYVVFAHNGRGSYSSTLGKTCSSFGLPDPPTDLEYEPEQNAIRLTWKLLNVHDLRAVRIIRRRVTVAGEEKDEKQIEIQPGEYWRDGGLYSGTRYDYLVHAVDLSGQLSESAMVRAATLVPALTGFVARVINRNQVSLTWNSPAETTDWQDVVLTRTLEAEPEKPEQIYIGTDTNHIDRDLGYDAAYIYMIYLRYADPIRSEPRTIRVNTSPRPAGVDDIRVSTKRKSVLLQWDLPEHESVRRVKLVRKEFSRADDKVIARELASDRITEYLDRQVEPGTSYNYLVYVESVDGHISSPRQVEVDTLPQPSKVHDVKATLDDTTTSVSLTWHVPDDKTIVGTHIIRHVGEPPTGLANGEIVFHGAETQVVDGSIEASRTYYYALYTYDEEEAYSLPVYKRVLTHPRISLWVYYTEFNERVKVRLPAGLTMSEVVAHLLSQKGVDLNTVSDWTATIKESGQVLSPQDSLQHAGVQSDQTICLTFVKRPPDDFEGQGNTSAEPDVAEGQNNTNL
jgi:hypothetical protein